MQIAVIDVGGTYIKYACMDEMANIISRGKLPTPLTNRKDFIDTIVDIYESMSNIEGLAISMTGIIDSERGRCIESVNLKYNSNFDIVDELGKVINVPITIENDAKCAAYAEITRGSLSDVKDAFVMIFGTSIGGTVIKNREIHRGIHFSAGEILFLITNKTGKLVTNDIFGNQSSALSLRNLYSGITGILADSIDGVKFFDLVNTGNDVAVKCLNQITRQIAVQIHNIQMLLDPQKIAIGGGISIQPAFIESIKQNLNSLYENAEFEVPRAEVVACKFHNDANLIGALDLHLLKVSREI